jgi:hypothetical protein
MCTSVVAAADATTETAPVLTNGGTDSDDAADYAAAASASTTTATVSAGDAGVPGGFCLDSFDCVSPSAGETVPFSFFTESYAAAVANGAGLDNGEFGTSAGENLDPISLVSSNVIAAAPIGKTLASAACTCRCRPRSNPLRQPNSNARTH